jgi:hypothetical protein
MRKLGWSLLRLGLVLFTLIFVVRASALPSAHACVVCKWNSRTSTFYCGPVLHGYVTCTVSDAGHTCEQKTPC